VANYQLADALDERSRLQKELATASPDEKKVIIAEIRALDSKTIGPLERRIAALQQRSRELGCR
jgi:hypothetical protein